MDATSIAAATSCSRSTTRARTTAPARRPRALLQEHGYRDARTVHAHDCSVADEPGGLLGCIERIERTDGPVYEIFVGTPDADGGIPVQITTRKDVAGDESAY